MTDNVLPPGAGQAPNPFQATTAPGQQPVAPAAGEQGNEQPQYLTVQQAEALKQAILREAQSLVDKSGSRIEKEVAKIRDQFSANGVQMTPEQETALRANLAKMTPAPSPAEPVTPQPAQAQDAQAQIDPALVIASKVMQSAGVSVLETDPEFASIQPFIGQDGTVAKPVEMLQALNGAIAAKLARESAKNNPSARIPLGGHLPAGKPVTTSREAWGAGDLFK